MYILKITVAQGEKPSLSCDFEDKELCGWTHDLNHDFDWRRENHNTPSGAIGTGPSYDHTKGIGEDGYYMYIESSSRNENDTARLISPVYDKVDTEVCFEFYYHMFGATTGSLRAYVKKISENWNLDPKKAFFSMSGNQGDRWYRAFHRLGIIDDEFQIIIEGVRGPGYISDIAIDDVKLIPNCTVEENDAVATTTEGTTSITEMIQIVDTCDNRCGQKEPISHNVYHLTCDCDATCFDNNRCCPDYLDHCAFSTTDAIETTTSTEPPNINVNKTRPLETTAAPVKTTANSQPPRFVSDDTSKYNKTVITSTTLPAPSISTKRLTKAATITTISPRPNTRPTIKIETPPRTTIIRKVFTRLTTKVTTTAPTLKLYSRRSTIKPTKQTTKMSLPIKTAEEESNDIMEFMPPYPESKSTSAFPDDESSKEYWSDEYENVDSPGLINFSETEKLSVRTISDTHYNLALILICGSGLVMLVSAIAFIVIRRQECFKRRIHFSNNGDSQSDVRFLTNNEELDFTYEL
ncbi:unnamed protein product [Acanthoscelides obtectus]|uniref:Uncharacterized protein n=1 Tax=Acanthoscelides obtectus TaxID=200917 RepID=A0A9P0PK73_ACAOB|nr:unnamed protein product [Acanthoscelides obtectus]CAK1659781.1 MAM domain-containing glycosylphosphatidylinositol anchor protein 1 [Acanthoscelides obtectus]